MRLPPRILIAGYYGFGNLGDEAILASMVHDLRAQEPSVLVTVVSGSPDRTRALHRVEAVQWRDIAALQGAVVASDLVLIGGGGLFHDYWPSPSKLALTPWHSGLSFLEGIALLCQIEQRPMGIYAVGVGPLRTSMGAEQTRRIFETAVAATVRDTRSHQVLRDIGLSSVEQVLVTADPAFGVPLPSEETRQRLRDQYWINEGEPIYGVVLRYWDKGPLGEGWQNEVAGALDRFLAQHEGRVLFIPFQREPSSKYGDDRVVAWQVRQRMYHRSRAVVLDPIERPEVGLSLLSCCSVVLAMRLHAAIFAFMCKRPVVGMAYDPKVASLFEDLGVGSWMLHPNEWRQDKIEERLEAAVKVPANIFEGLGSKLEQRRSLAHQNASLILERASHGSPRPTAESLDFMRYFVQVKSAAFEAERIRAEELQRALARASEQAKVLDEIQTSRGWRLVRALWKIRGLLLPSGGVRTRALAAITRPVRSLMGKPRVRAPGIMSWYEYRFDRDRRMRDDAVPCRDLSAIRWAGEVGLVSVVLPAYNAKDLLPEAVESLRRQTFSNWELVAVDDGSTDGTGELLDTFAEQDPRIRVIHQENEKLPRALNRGFAEARGQWLTWTSCDNRLKPVFLERMVDCLERHPEWDAAYANLDIIGEQGEPLRGSSWYLHYQVPPGSEHIHLPSDTSLLNVWPNNYVGAAFLYRSRVAGLIGDYSPWRFGMEDYDYWMRVNGLMRLRHVDFDEPVYEYRFHSHSLTSRDEDLGITRNRGRLMVFDDFRRDFYLWPLAWWVESDGTEAAEQQKARLEKLATRFRHVWNVQDKVERPIPSNPWFPLVYLQIVQDPEARKEPPPDLPSHALRVLLSVSNTTPDIEDDWKLCATLAHAGNLPSLRPRWRGWASFPSAELVFTALDIKARSHLLAQIESQVEAADKHDLKISVVVCTFQRGEQLKRTLDSVAEQTFPRWDYEIIVVNNDPRDPTPASVVEQVRKAHFGRCPERVRVVECPFLGLSYARNIGLGLARGEVVCFLDDDAVADKEWLDWLWWVYETRPEAGVVGGRIRLRWPSPRPGWIKDGWDGYWSGFTPEFAEAKRVEKWWEFPWGANWSARRKALLEVGGFRASYGRAGQGFQGGEEIVAARLIQDRGHAIFVEPRAEVVHEVDPRRFSRAHVVRTILSGRSTWYRMQRDLYLPWEAAGWRALLLLARRVIRLPERIVSHGLMVPLVEIIADTAFLFWLARDYAIRLYRSLARSR